MGCAPSPENQNIMSRVPRGQNGNMTLPVVWKRHYSATCIASDPRAGILFSTTPSSCLTRLEPALPGASPTPLHAPFTLDQAFLLVWPSTRRLWPPPCSLLAVRSVRENWLLIGKCSCRMYRGKGCVATNFIETWIWESRMPTTRDFGGGWPTVCHSLVACSLL